MTLESNQQTNNLPCMIGSPANPNQKLIERIERRLTESGVPDRFLHAEFSKCTYAPDSTVEQIAKFQQIKKFFESWSKEPEGFTFLFGATGTGKSYLATCVLRRFIGYHLIDTNNCRYCRFDLIDQIRNAVAKDQADQFVRSIANAKGLMVIDDLGVGRIEGWPGEQLCRILYSRYDSMLPTLITSNHDLRWIATNIDARVADRIAESNQVFEFTGPNRRIKRKEQ